MSEALKELEKKLKKKTKRATLIELFLNRERPIIQLLTESARAQQEEMKAIQKTLEQPKMETPEQPKRKEVTPSYVV